MWGALVSTLKRFAVVLFPMAKRPPLGPLYAGWRQKVSGPLSGFESRAGAGRWHCARGSDRGSSGARRANASSLGCHHADVTH
jgi:hypothetical protein